MASSATIADLILPARSDGLFLETHYALSKRKKWVLECPRPVVFSYNGGIGDRICNLPALRALAFALSGRMILICDRGDIETYYRDLPLQLAIEVDFRQRETDFAFDWQSTAKAIPIADAFICLNPWHGDDVNSLMTTIAAPLRVGFFREYNVQLDCDHDNHAIDMAFAIPNWIMPALAPSLFKGGPRLSEKARRAALQFRVSHAQRYALFVHADTKSHKEWPLQHFETVLRLFLEKHPEWVVLLSDSRGIGWFRTGLPERAVTLRAPLTTVLGVIGLIDGFLGIDSCLLHAADLYEVPGIGLFGGTHSRRWGFRFSSHWHIQANESLEEITPESVQARLADLARFVETRAGITQHS